jgi:hypothetical protein
MSARASEHARLPLQVLEHAAELVTLFGVANDAFDHGSVAEAAELRQRATSGLRTLLARHPALLDLAPRLPQMLDGELLTYTWPTVLKAFESAIASRHEPTRPRGETP